MFEHMKIRTFLIAWIGVFIGIGIILGFDLEDPFKEMIFSYTILGLFPIIWFRWQISKNERDLSEVIYWHGFKKYLPHLSLTFIVLFIFSLGVVWLNSFLLSFALPDYVEWFLQEEDLLPTGRPIIYFLMVIYISFVGPVAEELIFRGLLLKRLTFKYSRNVGLIVSSGLFGVLHFDIIGGFIFGFIMAIVYLYTNNLLAPIALHIANNFIAMMLYVFNIPLPNFFAYQTVAEIQSASLPNIILLIITTPLLVIVMKKYFVKEGES